MGDCLLNHTATDAVVMTTAAATAVQFNAAPVLTNDNAGWTADETVVDNIPVTLNSASTCLIQSLTHSLVVVCSY